MSTIILPPSLRGGLPKLVRAGAKEVIRGGGHMESTLHVTPKRENCLGNGKVVS